MIWFNPCFASPFRNAGYDVSDYTTTAPQPVADEAAFAASLLLDRLQKPAEGFTTGNHLLPTALIERSTVKRHRA